MGITRHSNFRLFARMNPATDAGNRDLPFSFRSRFTEYAVDDDLCDDDLAIFVRRFLGGRESDRKLVRNIVYFYKEARRLSQECLQDGANQEPQYSLRSIYRALEYAIKAEGSGGFPKALYDGFSMFLLSLLDASSAKIMNPIIQRISRESSRCLLLKLNRPLDDNRAFVKAVRNGHWIVLVELNLAPSDVLEALNRLLDDNRELFVLELHETISAQPHFMLFVMRAELPICQDPHTSKSPRIILAATSEESKLKAWGK